MGLMNRVLTSQGQSSLLQRAKELRSFAQEAASEADVASVDLPDQKKKPSPRHLAPRTRYRTQRRS